MLPKLCIAESFFTMTPRLDITSEPRERLSAIIIGKSSGVSPTARAIAKRNDSRSWCWEVDVLNALTKNTKMTRMRITFIMRTLKSFIPRSKSFGSSLRVSDSAIELNFVFLPVARTDIRPFPVTTLLPINTDELVSFSTGNDSPVSDDSFTKKSFACKIVPSAGITSPGERTATSPGTMRERGISASTPSRRTVAVIFTRSRSASAALWDLYVLMKSMATLKITIAMIINESMRLPKNPEMSAAMIRMIMSGFLNFRKKFAATESFLLWMISFDPYSLRRCCAS